MIAADLLTASDDYVQEFKNTMCSTNLSMKDTLNTISGRNDISFATFVLNDLNTDKVLVSILNGVVIDSFR